MTASFSDTLLRAGRPIGFTVALALVIAVATLGLRTQPNAFADGTFRACVLSHDMPLSNESADDHSGRTGLYLDLASAMAEREQADLQSHFAVTAFYKRPVREGLMAEKCDAYFGLPRADGPWFIPGTVALTKSFTSIGYALALPSGERVNGLDDLKGKTVAVQGGSPGAIAVSYVDGINTLTYRFATPALQALENGEVDAALVWGPKAGYYQKHVSPGAFEVYPTTLQWPVAIGVRAADRDAMVPHLDRLIDETAGLVAQLRSTYGLPDGPPIQIELRGPTPEGDNYDDTPEDTTPEKKAGSDDAAGETMGTRSASTVQGIGRSATNSTIERTLLQHVPYADTTEADLERGAKLFNSTYGCAHCHGTDALGATMGTNLRTMEQRYGDKAREVFMETVLNGRDGTAMPPWKGVISDDKIADIQAFIFSLQETE